jgi:hypothetical protein
MSEPTDRQLKVAHLIVEMVAHCMYSTTATSTMAVIDKTMRECETNLLQRRL